MGTKLTVDTVIQKALQNANSVLVDAMSKTASANESGVYRTELAQCISKLASTLRTEHAKGVTYDDVFSFAHKLKGVS